MRRPLNRRNSSRVAASRTPRIDDAERALGSARLGCHWGSLLYSRGDERCVAWRTVQVGAKSLNIR